MRPGASPSGFGRSFALLVAIDGYRNGVPPLKTPVADAHALGEALAAQHGFDVELLLEADATLARLKARLAELKFELRGGDRVLLYFAGHGVAADGDAGPEGFLLPADAAAGDRSTFWPMVELHAALACLPARHLLLILDCCFAGAFRWSSGRDLREPPRQLHAERYEWFIRDAAWQVVASAAHDQQALDVVAGEPIGARDDPGRVHSPFAAALLEGLAGAADLPAAAGRAGDGVITATELYLFLRQCLQPEPGAMRANQTPSLWPLPRHDKGEFVFLAPGVALDLPPAPPLSVALNPWRGLQPYAKADADLFFGRGRVADALAERLRAARWVAVVGPSGSGKSSLVAAGAIPRLAAAGHRVASFRPGEFPLRALVVALLGEATTGADRTAAETAFEAIMGKVQPLLLVIDQLEELVTTACGHDALSEFSEVLAWAMDRFVTGLAVCVSVRSDFEALLLPRLIGKGWRASRFVIPPMTQDELRRCIEGPAAARVMRFESDALVDELINEVVQTPAPLPLLSFVLSEMYLRAVTRGDGDRGLRLADYDRLEGVAGALQHRVAEEYSVEPELQLTFQRVFLRLVSLEGGELARRRIDQRELRFADESENARVERVLNRLVEARLLVTDEVGGKPLVEPAHEALIRGWDRIAEWIRDARPSLGLLRAFGADAVLWARDDRPQAQLWHQDPRLPLVEALVREQEQGPLKLNAVETAFLEASVRRRRKELWRNRGLSGAVAMLVVIAAAIGLVLDDRVRQRETTASLLSRTNEITSRLDGVRQLDGLMAAIDAADLSRSTFAQMTPEIRGSFVRALTRAREVDRWPAGVGTNFDPAVTPAGDEVLITYSAHTPDSRPIIARLWTLAVPRRSRDITTSDPVEAVARCWDGACVVARHADRTDVFDLKGRVNWRLPAGTPVESVDADDDVLVAVDATGRVTAQRTGTSEVMLGRLAETPKHVRLSTNRRHALILTEGPAYLADLDQGGVRRLEIGSDLVSGDVALAPDGSYVLLKGGPGEVFRNGLDGREPQLAIRAGRQRVGRIIISRDGQLFAFTSETEGATFVVDQELGLRFNGPLYGGATQTIDFTPDGKRLVEIGQLDRAIKIFDLDTPSLPERRTELKRALTAVAVCEGSGMSIWGDQSGEVGVISINATPGTAAHVHSDYVERLLCLPGNQVVSAARDGRVRLWDGPNPTGGRFLGPADEHFRDVAVSADGRSLLATSGKWVWRLGLDGAAERLFQAPLDDINRIAVSRSGVIALGSSGSGMIVTFDQKGRRMTEPFQAHVGLVMALAFSPWNETLASGGTIGTTNLLSMSLWDIRGKQLQSATAHPTLVTSVAFDSTDQLIASGGSDGAVRLWDENLLQIGPDLAHLGELVAGVAVMRATPLFVLAGSKGRVVYLDLSDQSLMGHACRRLKDHARYRTPVSDLDRRVRSICYRQLTEPPTMR